MRKVDEMPQGIYFHDIAKIKIECPRLTQRAHGGAIQNIQGAGGRQRWQAY